MATHWRHLRRIGWVLGCLFAVLSLAAALPQDREWGELATTVLMIVFLMGGIPVLLLTSIDVGAQLRRDREAPRWARVLGYVLSVPQVALGLAAVVIGSAMIGWMLYLHADVLPWYLSALLGFGMWPVVTAFGLHLVRTAIRGRELDTSATGDRLPGSEAGFDEGT
jgi:hypothetical protein